MKTPKKCIEFKDTLYNNNADLCDGNGAVKLKNAVGLKVNWVASGREGFESEENVIKLTNRVGLGVGGVEAG